MTAERDPNGLDLNTVGAKGDAGKLRIHLVLNGFAPALNKLEHLHWAHGLADPPTSDLGLFYRLALTSPAVMTAQYLLRLLSADYDRKAPLIVTCDSALMGVVEIGGRGAEKYTDDGWLAVPNGVARYKDAMLRHLRKLALGEEHDQDWGTHHLHHALWNALAVMTLEGGP